MKQTKLLILGFFLLWSSSAVVAKDLGISEISFPEDGIEINPLVPFLVKATVTNYDEYFMDPENYEVNVLLDGEVIQTVTRRNLDKLKAGESYEIEVEVVLGDVEQTSGMLCLETVLNLDKKAANDRSPDCLELSIDANRDFDIAVKNVVMVNPENVQEGSKVKAGGKTYEFTFELENEGTVVIPVGTPIPFAVEMAGVILKPYDWVTTKELKEGDSEEFLFKSLSGALVPPFPDKDGALFNMCFRALHDADKNDANDFCMELEVEGTPASVLEVALQQIDVLVKNETLHFNLSAYHFDQDLHIKVYDLQGKSILAQNIRSGGHVALGLPPSAKNTIVLVSIEVDGTYQSRKLFVH